MLIDGDKEYKVFMTGHSLGGALATIMAYEYTVSGYESYLDAEVRVLLSQNIFLYSFVYEIITR